jgi:hypothetical protein
MCEAERLWLRPIFWSVKRVFRQIESRLRRALSETIVENSLTKRALRLKFAPFDMIFTDVWQQYYRDTSMHLEEKLKVLCSGMDETSAKIAATVSERYFYIAPPCGVPDLLCRWKS